MKEKLHLSDLGAFTFNPMEQPMQITPGYTPTPTPVRRINHLTFSEKLVVRKELAKVLIKCGTGFVEYPVDMDDNTVAATLTDKMGRVVTFANVSAIRRSEFGQLYKPKNSPPVKDKPETITVTIDPNPELLATLAVAHKEIASLKSELLTLSDIALELATRCGRIVEGK